MARTPKAALSYIVAASPQSKGRQRSVIEGYAKVQHIDITGEFADDPSATTRPGLGALLMAIRDRKVKLVLIAGVKYLGDTLVEQHTLIGLMAHRRARVIDCSSGDCVSTGGPDDAQLVRDTVVLVEELRKQTTAGRLTEARKSGRSVGQKPYGTRPQEKPVVDLIMQLRRERGWGVRRIANELNRRGLVNRLGGKWQPTAIQRIFDRHE